MTFDAVETSEQDGAPVELYLFVRGSAVLGRFTASGRSVEWGGEDWAAETLSRGAVEASPELARNPIRISTRRSMPIADLFRVHPPTDVIGLTVFRYHRGDDEAAVIWMGRVLNCDWRGAEAVLNCEPVSTSLKRPGLRRLYQAQCPHVLYAQGEGLCNVVRSAHWSVATVTGISGLVLSVDALADKPYAGGFVEWVDGDGNAERRFIRDFSGTDLTLTQPFQGIAVDDEVTVSPGCDHTMATCDEVYDNLPNYGGFPFIPQKNPFGGNPVY